MNGNHIQSDCNSNDPLFKACHIKDWSRIESIIVSVYDEKYRFIQDVMLYHKDSLKINSDLTNAPCDNLFESRVKTAITVNYIC